MVYLQLLIETIDHAYNMLSDIPLAEWLGNGLQNRKRRFDSDKGFYGVLAEWFIAQVC